MENFKQHEFNAEWVDDKHGPAIMLTQSDGYCEPQTVLAHPWQFRAVCEHFNVLPTGDDQARRSISTLTRRLRTLAERIGELREYVATYSDHEHADLHVETVMLNALGDLANEWAEEMNDLAPPPAGVETPPQAPERATSPAKHPGKATAPAGAGKGLKGDVARLDGGQATSQAVGVLF